MSNGNGYNGPAGIVLTPDEILIVWSYLTRIPDSENAEVRRRCRAYLDGREGHSDSTHNGAVPTESK